MVNVVCVFRYYHGKTYFSGLRKAGLLNHFEPKSKDPTTPTLANYPGSSSGSVFNLPHAMRKMGSAENLASSFDSNASNSAFK